MSLFPFVAIHNSSADFASIVLWLNSKRATTLRWLTSCKRVTSYELRSIGITLKRFKLRALVSDKCFGTCYRKSLRAFVSIQPFQISIWFMPQIKFGSLGLPNWSQKCSMIYLLAFYCSSRLASPYTTQWSKF